MTFWEGVRNFAARRVRAAFTHHYGEMRCRVCHTWSSEVGGLLQVIEERDAIITQCKQCEHWTRWDMRFMGAYLHDNQPEEKI